MSSTTGLVSVIVPVYRVEDYVSRCVESLTGQTYQHLEVILVDDGSPDRCGEMCDSFAAQDPRIRVIHQTNQGLSAARNAGLDAARGSYLMFVDSDDWIHRTAVAHLLDASVELGAEVAVCSFIYATSDDVSRARSAGAARAVDSREALGLYAGKTAPAMTSAWGKLFLSNLFDDLRFPLDRLHEDEFTTYRAIARAKTVALTDAQLYFYFTRPGSITHGGRSIKQFLDHVDALRGQAEFFQALGLAQVSGDCLRRAFLAQRQLRARVAASGDQDLQRKLATETREVAAALRSSPQSWLVKVVARSYVSCPRLLDAAFSVFQPLARRSRKIHRHVFGGSTRQ